LDIEWLLLDLAEPVVTLLFILVWCVIFIWWVVVLWWRVVVAPGPTLPSLEAPGAGCVCAKAPPADSASTHADAKRIFFIVISLV
jgi:hypothetical protein